MTPKKERPALGRGLGALIPAAGAQSPAARSDATSEAAVHTQPATALAAVDSGSSVGSVPRQATGRREYFLCAIEEVAPSPDNPRHRFDEQGLSELADSIRSQGLIQPLVVRQRSADEQRQDPGSRFSLIAGERRWRAAQRAGLKDVPVVVKDVDAAAAFELALVENIQRQDLNPIEEAEAYRRLSDEFGYTQEELSRRVGRDRSTVANSLRLLKLPPKVREQVAVGEISSGHAKVLLGLELSPAIEQNAALVVQRQLSVRQTEELVRRAAKQAEAAGKPDKAAKDEAPPAKSAGVRDLEERLQKALGTRVALKQTTPRSGTIEIQYHSLDELDRLLAQLTGQASSDE